jgi:hypothetical protein
MQLKAGLRLRSAVCTTELIVVKAPTADVDLRVGGHPVLPAGTPQTGETVDPTHAGGSAIGKRFADDEAGLEVLITKAGEGSLSIGDAPLLPKEAKQLPSSD